MVWRRRQGATVIPAIVLGLTGSAVSVVLPGITAEAVPTGRVANGIISVEMLGATLATALLSPLLGRTNRRAAALVAALVALASDLLSIRVTTTETLVIARLLAGLAEGTALALGVAYVAVSEAAERNLGLFVAANLLTATLILRILPFVAAALGQRSAFLPLAVLAALSLVAATSLPSEGDRTNPVAVVHGDAASADMPSGISGLAIGAGLAGNIVLAAGGGTVWPAMAALGSMIHVPLATTAHILGDATMAGLAGALLAAWAASMCTRQVALTAGTLGILVSLIVLGSSDGEIGFTVAAMLFMASWIFVVPFYVAVLAAADPAGRAAAFSMATQYGGLALGASVAGLLSGRGRDFPILASGGALIVLALLLMSIANRMVGRCQPSQDPAHPISSHSRRTLPLGSDTAR